MIDLTDENIVKIVRLECSDDDVNVLVWRCLGYVYDQDSNTWDSKNVFPKWAEKYPQPVGIYLVYVFDIMICYIIQL
jgi:hypothetical protein